MAEGDIRLELDGGKKLKIGLSHLELHGAYWTFEILQTVCFMVV